MCFWFSSDSSLNVLDVNDYDARIDFTIYDYGLGYLYFHSCNRHFVDDYVIYYRGYHVADPNIAFNCFLHDLPPVDDLTLLPGLTEEDGENNFSRNDNCIVYE